MKNIFKKIVVLALAAVMVCCLFACETHLKGTYTSTDKLIKQTFNFKDDNEVTFTAFGISANGTYKIEDGEIEITYSILGLSQKVTKSFSKKGKSIFIDGVEYTKD